MAQTPRIAARGILLRDDKLLIVNAWKGATHLWCAPGGGVDVHDSLRDTVAREIYEECGLQVAVGAPCLVNEFHDPGGPFHQIDIYFRCTLLSGETDMHWADPEGVVSHRRWVSRAELAQIPHKPDSLAEVAWDDAGHLTYDPLEPIVF